MDGENLNKGANHSQHGVNEALTAEAHVDGFQVDLSVILVSECSR